MLLLVVSCDWSRTAAGAIVIHERRMKSKQPRCCEVLLALSKSNTSAHSIRQVQQDKGYICWARRCFGSSLRSGSLDTNIRTCKAAHALNESAPAPPPAPELFAQSRKV